MYVCMCSTGTVCLWNVVRYRRSTVVANSHTYIHTFMSKDKKTRLYKLLLFFIFLKHVCVHTHTELFFVLRCILWLVVM